MADCLAEASARSIGKSNSLFHRPQHGVSPPAPRQRLASPVGSRQATGPRRRARTGRVAGDGQPALLGLLGGSKNSICLTAYHHALNASPGIAVETTLHSLGAMPHHAAVIALWSAKAVQQLLAELPQARPATPA
jgi:hypothetical protein